MPRFIGLILFITVASSAATVQTFYSSSAFENAAGSRAFTTESFAGDQINTPGLSVSACSNPAYPGSGPLSCTQLSKAQLNNGSSYFQFITQNMFTDAVGRNPNNPYSANSGTNEFVTLFTLPSSATAVSFDVNELPSGTSTFGIALGNNDIQYPFGGFTGSIPNLPANGTPYDGFVGFISDTPFNTVELSAFYNPGVSYTLDNLAFDDPPAVPEPAALLMSGIGFIALFLLKRLRAA